MIQHFLIILLLASSFCLAKGGSAGSGGSVREIDGVYYLLDLVEQGNHLNPRIDKNSTYSIHVEEIINQVGLSEAFGEDLQLLKLKLGELESSNPIIVHAILEAAQRYRWLFLDDISLVSLGDEYSSLKGGNIQIAIRKNSTIRIDQGIFEQLPSAHKVALFLHEIVSALAPDKLDESVEQTTSREAVALLFSKKGIEALNTLEWTIICSVLPCGYNNSIPSLG